MIAAESAIFVTLDIVLSPSFVRRRRCSAATAHPIRSTNNRVIPGVAKVGASLQITFSSPVSEGCWPMVSSHLKATRDFPLVF
jgi:hypothetical protein